MRRSAKERQDAIDVVQKTLHAGLIAWAKVCGDAVIWCEDIGSVPHEVSQLCDVCGSRFGMTHYASLIAISLLQPGDQSCVLSMGLQAGVFPCSAGACSRRPHTRTERERDTAGGGGVATPLQTQSVIVEYCGWADRDQVLIEARRSVQCVVRGFLEMSAHKSHHYISRYPEIFWKKVAAYSPENTVYQQNCCRCCRDRHRDVSMNRLSSYSWQINRSWWSPG